VATEGGLVTPLVREADRKELEELSDEIRLLATRAREGKLTPREYQGGSFTVSNLGMFGVDSVYPIVNPPQSCILGVGQGSERPVVRDGQLAVGNLMTLTLSADHRAVDGAIGAQLLAAIQRRVEDPLEMLL
jgi:pyruvate dehydrogenase E2 component (dihydrolipoamide acetyltransferase)